PSALQPLLKIVQAADTEPHLRLEAISALGGFHDADGPGMLDTLMDLLTDKNPSIRPAALRSVPALDPEGFVTVLSGLDPDAHWSVRAALASVLATFPLDASLPRLTVMLTDSDQRVIPSVLAALVKLNAPNIGAILLDKLRAD